MNASLRAVATGRGGVFTRADAISAGYSSDEIRGRLLAGSWHRLRRGVYTDGAPSEAAGGALLLAAVAARTSSEAFWALSHDTAAKLHQLAQLDSPAREAPPAGATLPHVHATVPRSGVSRSYPGLTLHASHLPVHHIVTREGHRVTSTARTVVDLARRDGFAAGVVTADSALRAGLARAEFAEVVDECRGWPGGRRAERVLAFADARAEAPSESLARVLLAEHGLPQPELQAQLADRDGFIGRVDLLLRGSRTVLEVDGKIKYADDPDALWREKQREDRLRAAGYAVVRLTWQDVRHDTARTAARIRRAIVLSGERAGGTR